MEESSISKLGDQQIEVCITAEYTAKELILAEIMAKRIEGPTNNVKTQGTRTTMLIADAYIMLSSIIKRFNIQDSEDEAISASLSEAER